MLLLVFYCYDETCLACVCERLREFGAASRFNSTIQAYATELIVTLG